MLATLRKTYTPTEIWVFLGGCKTESNTPKCCPCKTVVLECNVWFTMFFIYNITARSLTTPAMINKTKPTFLTLNLDVAGLTNQQYLE